ncbi:cyclic nucleotide-binding domain-containing protein [Elusimicrobiota bacterium]
MAEKLDIGPVDLEWLGGALKLDQLISDKPALEQVLRSFPAISLELWSEGEDVIKEGDGGDDFFVIYKGSLSVWRKSDEERAAKIGELAAGDFFGEIGFLMKAARSATVRTGSKCKIFRFPAEEFTTLLLTHKMLDRWVKTVACERLFKIFKVD